MLLLDTDVMIDVMRRYPTAIAWLESRAMDEVLLPGFVVLELLQGCRGKSEQERVERAITPYRVVWPSDEAVRTYAQFHLSHNLGFIDALIGHTALLLDLPLHTFNQKHYAVVPGLKTIEPYRRVAGA